MGSGYAAHWADVMGWDSSSCRRLVELLLCVEA
jgi:hypothetical protein